MDHGLLLAFLLTGCWLYGAALLALHDWRWNRRRIAQFLACAALGGWVILTQRANPSETLILIVLFSLTLLVPPTLQRRIGRLFSQGRNRAGRFWVRVLSALTWRSPEPTLAAIERLRAAAMAGAEPDTALAAQENWFARMHSVPSRRAFIEGQIEALAALRDHAGAVELFEREFSSSAVAPSAGALYTASISYSQLGLLEHAARCIRRAEEAGTPDPRDLRRFIAFVHLFGQAGRPEALERLIERNAPAAAHTPPGYLGLWRGIALQRSGRADAARATFAATLGQLGPGDERVRRMIEQRLYAPAERPLHALDEHTEEQLRLLEALLERQTTLAVAPTRERPVVTYALMAVCAAAWLMTELIGSSTDAHTLVRMGANVPGMVRAGEWWRLISSIFLHVGWLHLLLNLYSCHLFGEFVERTAGRWETFAVFLISGVCGSLASALLGSHTLSAGASGAIFGLLGAAIVIALTFRTLTPQMQRMHFFNFAFMAAFSMLYGLLEPRIDNLAHAGGLAAGAFTGLWLGPSGLPGLRKTLFRAVGGLLLVCLGAAVWIAGRYALAGGYPEVIPPLRTFSAPDGRWSIHVPVFWREIGRTRRETVFLDPLGAGFKVFSLPAARVELTPDPNETVLRQGKRQIGQYVFTEVSLIAVVNKERLSRRVFMTTLRRRTYVLLFECEADAMNRYEGLLERIVVGFSVGPVDGRSH